MSAVDHFALLEEPRRPWLDSGLLQAKFLARCAATHPDHFHSASQAEKAAANARFQAINAAYNCLREPKERLQHLLALERGIPPGDIHDIPPDTADLFLEVGQHCRGVDVFLTEKERAISPLVKAQLFEQAADWSGRLTLLQKKITGRLAEADATLRSLDLQWQAGTRPFAPLEQLSKHLSYLARWRQQLQERLVRLTL